MNGGNKVMKNDDHINRQDFLKRTCAGLCGCAAILCPSISVLEKAVDDPTHETPLDNKYEASQKWIKRFMDILDSKLDGPVLEDIMETNGKLCHQQAHPAPTAKIELTEFVKGIQKHVGKDNCRLEGNTVYFNIVSNPRGLKVADGYCLCPAVEKGPEGLSRTFCRCSAGYVREMFLSVTGRNADVEILETVKWGGKACRFKITFI